MRRKHARTYVKEIPADAVPIPEFPFYFISPAGEVFSHFGRFKKRGFSKNTVGYPVCVMKHESGKMKAVLVHVLVARLFVPGRAEGLEVNHRDMDKTNPRADNLEWVTHSENLKMAHAALPEWRKAVASGVSRPVIATDKDTGEEHAFASVKAAALYVGRVDAMGNISKATDHGRAAYGFYWRRTSKR